MFRPCFRDCLNLCSINVIYASVSQTRSFSNVTRRKWLCLIKLIKMSSFVTNAIHLHTNGGWCLIFHINYLTLVNTDTLSITPSYIHEGEGQPEGSRSNENRKCKHQTVLRSIRSYITSVIITFIPGLVVKYTTNSRISTVIKVS